MGVITISHETGSGGPEIGVALAARVNYRYVDQDVISQAAQRYGCVEEKLIRLDETKPSIFARFDVETRYYITVLQSALLDVAEADNVVILGRGGQILLRGISHVVRVLVRAAFDLRVKRVLEKMATRVGTVDVRTTANMVRRADQEKIGRVRYVFDVEWSDPMLYDVVISTDKLSTEASVELIAGLCQSPEFAPTERSQQAVRDRALASRVRAALSAHPEGRRYRINVEAHRGTIELEGTGGLEVAVAVAQAVPGVMEVKQTMVEMPPIAPFVG